MENVIAHYYYFIIINIIIIIHVYNMQASSGNIQKIIFLSVPSPHLTISLVSSSVRRTFKLGSPLVSINI